MASLSCGDYDALATRLIESGEDHALGILLDVAAVNKMPLDPTVLADALKVVEMITDIKYPYAYQDRRAIEPLLAVAASEELPPERQAFAAMLAVELAIKFDYPRQIVKKVLWKLREDMHFEEGRALLDMALDLLERERDSRNRDFNLIGGDVLSELPAERPPVVIGDGGTVRRPVARFGRNEPCRCGSGKKYKKCCYEKDQLRMRDASPYEGVTKAEFRENPALVDDASYIEWLRPYELKRLVPSKMKDDQLFTAYRQADFFGLRELAWDMLSELKGRPGKEAFALEHMADLFDCALKAQDMEMIRRIAPHLPEEDRYFSESYKLKHELLEDSDKFRDLESMCRKACIETDDGGLIELSYAFEDILPALSLVFGRAAIVSKPERGLDNELLIEAIHKSRITLDMEPWGDPIEDYWDWICGRDSERTDDQEKDDKIRELQEHLSEARSKHSSALKELQERERELADLEKRVQQSISTAPAVKSPPRAGREGEAASRTTEGKDEEQAQAVVALRKKIEALKDEVRSQQESRRLLRKELQDANERLSRQNEQKPRAEDSHEEEAANPVAIRGQIHPPEFTDSFRKSCEDLPSALVAKAMQAAVGFAVRDNAILRQTVGIERMPGHYRIRIGLHHRLIVRQTLGNELQILDVIPRKQLDTWIKQHAP
jgi:hypothetical protein